MGERGGYFVEGRGENAYVMESWGEQDLSLTKSALQIGGQGSSFNHWLLASRLVTPRIKDKGSCF